MFLWLAFYILLLSVHNLNLSTYASYILQYQNQSSKKLELSYDISQHLRRLYTYVCACVCVRVCLSVCVTKKKSRVKEQPISNQIFSQVPHMYNIFLFIVHNDVIYNVNLL